MPNVQTRSSTALGAGGPAAGLARAAKRAAEQALAEGLQGGTADFARRHSLEATCTSIQPS